MTEPLPPLFTSHACDVLADTTHGLTGADIVKLTAAYAVESDVTIPHPTYPFAATVANKRTALFENLTAFDAPQRYRIIRDLCEYALTHDRNRDAVAKLKLVLIARYGHLANETLGNEVDQALIERTKHWLGPFPDVLHLYDQAVQKHANGVFVRNVLDDLRLSLELLLKSILVNDKSLENQIAVLGTFIKGRGGSAELGNMFVKLVEYYTKYQNTYIKHNDAVVEEEVEFIFELTSSFMKHVVRLSYK
jgi:hypothetical protein